MKTLTMLGAAVMAAGCAVSAQAATTPAPPAATAAPAPQAVPVPPPGVDEAAADAMQWSAEERRTRAETQRARAEAQRVRAETQRARFEAQRVRVEAEKGQDETREVQLEEARQRLEVAAREVARLSVQLGPVMQHFQTAFSGAPHAIIGAELATENGPDGVRVAHVSPGGPADEAGMRTGDVIISVNGADAKGDAGRSAVRAIQDALPDKKLSIRVMREGKSKDLAVTPRMMPVFAHVDPNGPPLFSGSGAEAPVYSFRELGIPTLSSMQLVTLTPGLGHYFGTDKGVLVVRAPTRSDFQLQDGDVILSIDGREPNSGAHATRILASYQAGEKVTLHIMRDRKAVNLEAKLPQHMWNGFYDAPPGRDGSAPVPDRQ